MAKASLAIQVLPIESADPLNAINAAISVIQESGVVHEVGAMETTLEHDNAVYLMDIALAAHEAALKSSDAVQSNIRLLQRPAGLMSINDKTASFRFHDT